MVPRISSSKWMLIFSSALDEKNEKGSSIFQRLETTEYGLYCLNFDHKGFPGIDYYTIEETLFSEKYNFVL